MGATEVEGLNLKGWNSGRPCDYCRQATATVFCRAHSAFLCLSCDSRVHAHVPATRHERVLVCEVCEQAPAALTCKADAASLCLACDDDIHSANPLARRHERVPVEPFCDSAQEALAKSTSSCFRYLVQGESHRPSTDDDGVLEGLGISPSTVPPLAVADSKPVNFGSSQFDGVKSEDQLLFFPEMEPGSLLDFEFHNFVPQGAATDSLVPVQIKPSGNIITHDSNCFSIDFSRSKLSTSFDYVEAKSMNHSVSSSSVDVGVVPEGTSMSDASFPYIHNVTPPSTDVVSSGPALSSGTNSGSSQSGGNSFCGLDREARVLRYREKRKNRKFEKTIRYASRKAYAESRPRIKGRFAKRTEPDPDLGQSHHHRVFSPRSSVSLVGVDAHYGVVPTF